MVKVTLSGAVPFGMSEVRFAVGGVLAAAVVVVAAVVAAVVLVDAVGEAVGEEDAEEVTLWGPAGSAMQPERAVATRMVARRRVRMSVNLGIAVRNCTWIRSLRQRRVGLGGRGCRRPKCPWL